jgi:hypothetical protein
MVGVPALMSNPADSGSRTIRETALGFGMTVLSQVFSAVQFGLEEKLLKQMVSLEPL